MQRHRQGFVHLLYAIILAQFVLIAILLAEFSSEYLSNDFYRGWVNGNYPMIGYLLQGQLEALLIGVALGGTMLLIMAVKGERGVELGESSEERRVVISRSSERVPPIVSDAIIVDSVRVDPEDVMSELEKDDV